MQYDNICENDTNSKLIQNSISSAEHTVDCWTNETDGYGKLNGIIVTEIHFRDGARCCSKCDDTVDTKRGKPLPETKCV